jgi:hypothetical protein
MSVGLTASPVVAAAGESVGVGVVAGSFESSRHPPSATAAVTATAISTADVRGVVRKHCMSHPGDSARGESGTDRFPDLGQRIQPTGTSRG